MAKLESFDVGSIARCIRDNHSTDIEMASQNSGRQSNIKSAKLNSTGQYSQLHGEAESRNS